jgi:class 3 adenylate cyclase
VSEIDNIIKSKTDLFSTLGNLVSKNIDPLCKSKEIWERYGSAVAVLVLDSVGFTRVSREKGIVYFLSRVLEVRKIVIPVFDDYGCHSNHMESDSIFAFFEKPENAVDAAIAANQAI